MANVFCEVCEKRLPEETVFRSTDFMGHTYFFCSVEDQEKFLANPDRFIKRDKETQQQVTGTIEPQLSAKRNR